MSDQKKPKLQLCVLTIVGGVVRDPEIRITKNGATVASLSIANTRGFGDKAHTSYFDCTAWEKTAELIRDYVKKGSQLSITGEIRQERWEDDKGNKRSSMKIYIKEMQFISSGAGKKQDENENPGGRDRNYTPPSRGQQQARDEFGGQDVDDYPSKGHDLFSDDDIPF